MRAFAGPQVVSEWDIHLYYFIEMQPTSAKPPTVRYDSENLLNLTDALTLNPDLVYDTHGFLYCIGSLSWIGPGHLLCASDS